LTFLQLAAEYKLRLTIAHTHDAREVAAELGRAGAIVIVGPLTFDASITFGRRPDNRSRWGRQQTPLSCRGPALYHDRGRRSPRRVG
jgi:hypothetical protein